VNFVPIPGKDAMEKRSANISTLSLMPNENRDALFFIISGIDSQQRTPTWRRLTVLIVAVAITGVQVSSAHKIHPLGRVARAGSRHLHWLKPTTTSHRKFPRPSLQGVFNRLRQSSIDEELFDVISGYEALSTPPLSG